ncbi:MAG: MOSC N-terminal beta barrel domain-containing protein [Chloroflexi bacterium]|nr:MOSC N-terminal beta barrel domain-containing protein [Chloroflexota bacterium]
MLAETLAVSELHVYPVKSCAETDVQVAQLRRRGILQDREFVLVGPNRHFLTCRNAWRSARWCRRDAPERPRRG